MFRALADQDVAYGVFGGIALALHGLPRATADVDLFLEATPDNVERLKRALHQLWDDPHIDEISAEDLCGDDPAVGYYPPSGFFIDMVTRLGTAFTWRDLEIEERSFDGAPVRVVSARTLWRMKRNTARPMDRLDAALLARRFGFAEES